jgi:hypothetical protein
MLVRQQNSASNIAKKLGIPTLCFFRIQTRSWQVVEKIIRNFFNEAIRKVRFSGYFHFQRLNVIENGGISRAHICTSEVLPDCMDAGAGFFQMDSG